MSAKLSLLQKLLIDREELVLLFAGQAFCSCGEGFADFGDIENHLVQSHEKLSKGCSRKSLHVILREAVNRLLSAPKQPGEEQQLDIKLPARMFAVCLDEDMIKGGGQVGQINCHECSAQCFSFKTLKDHYLRQHPGSWACAETCRNVDRILFDKPSSSLEPSSRKLPKSWSFHYYCPIPGCKYHVSQHHEGASSQSPKSFSTYSLLRQHYSKMHAQRSHACPKCGAGFATDVYLKRHAKLSCGRFFSCQACKATFSALENLQTHCRRKGHPLSQEVLCKKSKKAQQGTTKKSQLDKAPSLSKYVKIAPMPSLTMTAALALSELSAVKDSKSQENEDKGSKWSASTQTSPRGGVVAAAVIEQTLLKEHPKLGEIEQFSTETQTDDLELLLKPSVADGTTSPGGGHNNEDAFSTIEAQTQFDLDDILCSNYTQTVLFDTSLDQASNSAANSSGGVNSAETQTMLMSYDLVNMETQTMSMLFD